MKKIVDQAFITLFLLLLITQAVQVSAQNSKSGAYPGGDTTYHGTLNKFAYSHPSSNLSAEQKLDFTLGKAMFKRLWVSAPASTQAADGLGPLFNARSCLQCHKGNGRGRPQNKDGSTHASLLIRLNDPVYGRQLQTLAVTNVAAEGQVAINYSPIKVKFAHGEVVELRKPQYQLTDLAYGEMRQNHQLSPRMAPAMIGLGLLEAIKTSDLEQLADPDDINNDGISGRLGQGRFGWKADMPDLDAQVQQAFATDIGISVPLFPNGYGDCTPHQTTCLQLPNGNSAQYENLEAHSKMIQWTTHYVRNLAVPMRRNIQDPEVLRGKQLFHKSGCASCHQPNFVTENQAIDPAQAKQTIWPYSDLLLHDMGENLADKNASNPTLAREWRTPPLWGIGLTQLVNGNNFYLHDGRASSLLEAILWHGGEAQAARDKVVAMNQAQRTALVRFIQSL